MGKQGIKKNIAGGKASNYVAKNSSIKAKRRASREDIKRKVIKISYGLFHTLSDLILWEAVFFTELGSASKGRPYAFLYKAQEKYDYFDYLAKNKKLLKDIENRLKTNFTEYTEKQEKERLFCSYNKVEIYLNYIEKFEKVFLSDISKIAGLSHPDIKKIATKIENIYIAAKKEECLFFEPLHDELGEGELGNKYSGYISFKKDAYWGECWLQILPLLKDLQNNLDEAVNLKKI